MNNILKSAINKIIRNFKLELTEYPCADLKRRIKLIKHFKINKVLDVGANEGQYASLLRNLGFEGNIVSFEPYSRAFVELKKRMRKDKLCTVYELALGNRDGEEFLNISSNSLSSSFLDMMPIHLRNEPMSKYISREKVKVKRLDSMFHEIYQAEDRIFLKVDTQGFEKQVLEGADESLSLIQGVQLEMSIIPQYKGEMPFFDLFNLMKKKKFSLYSLETVFSSSETGQLLQVDGIFFRKINSK